jgi:LysR family transcriptional regulator, low CO2-responsive transcriptional regulator
MRDATFRQLSIFAALARHLSFSRAAEVLHLTQPAVSMQVRELERIVGLALYEKSGRRIALTDAGRELLRHANAAADLQRGARESMDNLRGLRTGTLKLSAVSTAKYFTPALLAAFTRQHPDLAVRFSVGNRQEVVADLANNDTDVVIMGRPPRELDTESVAIAPHPLGIIAPPAHPLARRRRIPLAQVAQEPFLIREQGSGTRASMEHVFRDRGLAWRSTMEFSSNETIKQAVIAGMGISFISLHTAGLELQTGRLVLLDVAGLPIVRDWHVIHSRDKRLPPAAVAFRQFLLQQGAATIERAVGLPALARRTTRK